GFFHRAQLRGGEAVHEFTGGLEILASSRFHSSAPNGGERRFTVELCGPPGYLRKAEPHPFGAGHPPGVGRACPKGRWHAPACSCLHLERGRPVVSEQVRIIGWINVAFAAINLALATLLFLALPGA